MGTQEEVLPLVAGGGVAVVQHEGSLWRDGAVILNPGEAVDQLHAPINEAATITTSVRRTRPDSTRDIRPEVVAVDDDSGGHQLLRRSDKTAVNVSTACIGLIWPACMPSDSAERSS